MGKRVFTWLLVLVMLMAALPWTVGAQVQPTLYWGIRGPSVRLAQRRLKAWGYYTGSIDGVYGPRMYRAITYFQRRNGLTPDGVVGRATWAALGESGGAAGGGGGSRSAARSDDQYLLARVISAEAKGEPFEGQVAVGAVILNRVRDSRFPHTVAGVIYEPDAFESVSNGAIYQTPTASSVRAAGDALNGWDPSGGAVFFWNPAKPVSRWIWSRSIITQIGNHVFAR